MQNPSHKQSPLQKNIVSKIDYNGGIEDLINNLQWYKQNLIMREKVMFNNLITYYQSLYLGYVNVENSFRQYRVETINHIELLEKCLNIKFNETLSLILSIANHGLNTTKNIRYLA